MSIKTYAVKFTGRTRNAIGKFYKIRTQVFAVDEDKARLALYDRFEHISQPEFKEILSPFGVDNLLVSAKNDPSVYDTIRRHVNGIMHAMGEHAERMAKANKEWHDDPESEDYGLYHSIPDLQYPAAVRMLAAAEFALYLMRETPTGLDPETFKALLLPECQEGA